jgi:hypothetical protein
LEAGPLSQWLFSALAEAELPVVCVETRHMQAVLKAQINKTAVADGEAVADPDWESKEGHYRVRLDNKRVDVPDNAVITEPNRAGRTMVWPLRIDAEVSIRCFMPGSMT